jgi:hypothetical protein
VAQRGYADGLENNNRIAITQAYLTAGWQRAQKLPKYEHLFIEAPSGAELRKKIAEEREERARQEQEMKKQKYYKDLEDNGI